MEGAAATCGRHQTVMGQIAVTVNSRTYRLACRDGDEDRLAEVATFVKGRVEQLIMEFGQAGDERLMLMAALLIADELMDLRIAAGEQSRAAATTLSELAANEKRAQKPLMTTRKSGAA